jgi:lysophospholipase L1-like esterase
LTDTTPTRRAGLAATAPGAVVLAVAAGALAVRGRTGAALVAVGVAAALLALGAVAPRAATGSRRRVQAVARRAGAGVLLAVTAVLGVVLVLPAHLVNRLVGARALDDGWDRPESAWRTRSDRRGPDGRLRATQRMGGSEGPRGPAGRPPLRRRRALLVGVVGAAVLLVAGSSRWPGPWPGADEQLTLAGYPVTGYAHAEEPWFPAAAREFGDVSHVWDPLLGSRLPDRTLGRYVNVRDGRRVTYQPPDPAVTVWYFGGSTMYGLGQRDGHTIPSEVARLAEREGLSIRGLNLGVNADNNWQETLRFAEALEAGPPPDLVVFYDGVNEQGTAYERVNRGDLDPHRSSRMLGPDQERELWAHGRDVRPPSGDTRELQWDLAAAQYRRGVDLARLLAADAGVPVLHVWQPTLATKAYAPSDQVAYDRTGLLRHGAGELTDSDEVRERSGADPIDLTAALDGIREPVYLDGGHTNELGARTVATALYGVMEPALRRALDEG